jgi:hypothetical protein
MSQSPTPATILKDMCAVFPDVTVMNTWGETTLFCNPGEKLKRGTYFLTLKEKDGAHDRASRLNRIGVFRLNFGLSKSVFCDLFGRLPGRPAKGGVICGDWDFTALDTLMPHPVYGWMGWVGILNPSAGSLANYQPLIAEAYAKARAAAEKRLGNPL